MSVPVDPTGCDDAHCPPSAGAPAVHHDAAADPAVYAIDLFYASLCDADVTATTDDIPPLPADPAAYAVHPSSPSMSDDVPSLESLSTDDDYSNDQSPPAKSWASEEEDYRFHDIHDHPLLTPNSLQGALKELGVSPIDDIEEVNLIMDNGNVIHFSHPKVQASTPSNTYAARPRRTQPILCSSCPHR